jgi:hypothetical protein
MSALAAQEGVEVRQPHTGEENHRTESSPTIGGRRRCDPTWRTDEVADDDET